MPVLAPVSEEEGLGEFLTCWHASEQMGQMCESNGNGGPRRHVGVQGHVAGEDRGGEKEGEDLRVPRLFEFLDLGFHF